MEVLAEAVTNKKKAMRRLFILDFLKKQEVLHQEEYELLLELFVLD